GAQALTLKDEIIGLVERVVSVVQSGEPVCTITFTNTDNQNVLPTGNLRVEKYLDLNGDGDANDPGEGVIAGWGISVSGAPITGNYVTNASGFKDFNGLETGDQYGVQEALPAGWVNTNTTVDGVSQGATTSTNATIPDGTTTVVRFYNQPFRTIRVHKNAVLVVNNGPEQNAASDDDGWSITV